jgi:hypothetical protein
LDFVRAFATRDIDEYLHEHGWTFSDIKSQFSDAAVSISVEMALVIRGMKQDIVWSIEVDQRNGRLETQESIRNNSKNKTILPRGTSYAPFRESIDELYLKSSFMKLIDENNPSEAFPEDLYVIKKFFTQSYSYELLAPNRMREKGIRDDVNDIGVSGERLAAYIDRMSASKRSKLNKLLTELVGYPTKASTETKKSGWVDLFVNETFSSTKTKVKAAHISDGMLRLIALVAASLTEDDCHSDVLLVGENAHDTSNSGFILLDEIEDGINLNTIDKVIRLLRKFMGEYDRQVIVTTHSPAVADTLKPEEIVYMWRNKEGHIQTKPMFSTEQMRRTLRALSPGEVWINYGEDEIIERLSTEAGNQV